MTAPKRTPRPVPITLDAAEVAPFLRLVIPAMLKEEGRGRSIYGIRFHHANGALLLSATDSYMLATAATGIKVRRFEPFTLPADGARALSRAKAGTIIIGPGFYEPLTLRFVDCDLREWVPVSEPWPDTSNIKHTPGTPEKICLGVCLVTLGKIWAEYDRQYRGIERDRGVHITPGARHYDAHGFSAGPVSGLFMGVRP